MPDTAQLGLAVDKLICICCCQDADNFLMKLLLKLIMGKLFPFIYQSVRIDPHNLPGLTPPTIAQFRPERSKPEEIPDPDYAAMYKKFLFSGSKRRLDTSKKRFDR